LDIKRCDQIQGGNCHGTLVEKWRFEVGSNGVCMMWNYGLTYLNEKQT
jgi:hypothetical protein